MFGLITRKRFAKLQEEYDRLEWCCNAVEKSYQNDLSKLDALKAENAELKSEIKAAKMVSIYRQSIVNENNIKHDEEIRKWKLQNAELKNQVEKLTRKRDAKGRFVKVKL